MDPEIYWQFKNSVEGLSKACKELETPVIGGNVSFYNESPKGAIYPTPIVGMVGLLDSIDNRVTMDFKDEGDLIFLLGANQEELGASEYLKLQENRIDGYVPEIDLKLEKRVQDTVFKAVKEGIVKSAHDCSEGGLAVALAESCFKNEIGVNIKIEENISDKALLFGETQSRIIVSIAQDNENILKKIAEENKIPIKKIGRTQGNRYLFNDLIELSVEEMNNKWENAIERKI
ncbi:MAG TPA: AIR synthase-related protein, partial [Halanaerobiales bacterium]|nr:AIR synthase-related protein [Halanaerobiales bacterium]